MGLSLVFSSLLSALAVLISLYAPVATAHFGHDRTCSHKPPKPDEVSLLASIICSLESRLILSSIKELISAVGRHSFPQAFPLKVVHQGWITTIFIHIKKFKNVTWLF